MPQSAISTGLADFILPLADMGKQLCELAHNRQALTQRFMPPDDRILIQRILAHVRTKTGHDFSRYKQSTVQRRVLRRTQVNKKENFVDYLDHLQNDPAEVQALFADLLISVTTFFRDAGAFEVLAAEVIPKLFEGRTAADVVRIWIPGCATGEEAYSLAILLLEEAARRGVRPELQVFASDLDAAGLATARDGHYPLAIEADVSEERLRRFFNREGDFYRVKRVLRETVLFASHSLLRDPPFGRLDLISCRNLLIYLDRQLQQQACGIFHYALRPGGYLFLGNSENADNPPQLFEIVQREARIYRSLAHPAERQLMLPKMLSHGRTEAPAPQTPRGPAPANPVNEAGLHRYALERNAPPSAVVDDMHRVVHLSDTAGRFLQPSAGPLSSDITELVRRELRFDLRTSLNRAFETGETTLSLPISVQFNGHPHLVYLQVRLIEPDADSPVRHAIVFFMEGEHVDGLLEEASPGSSGENRAAGETIRRLREELALTQNRLKSTREDAESATEELRAANEELQSINEEYRSTSEELETSKEELQSINEELQTVNAELKEKLESVIVAHSDLQNLMAATDVGVLFLDPVLCIKRFTPSVSELFNITAADEGRPITDFTHQLAFDGVAEEAAAVIEDLEFREREIASRAQRWYLMRLRPYRTVDDRIDGVVVTFIDITERRAAEDALRQSEQRLRQMTQLVEMSNEPICVWDFDDGIVEWNHGSELLFGYRREEALGREKQALLASAFVGSTFADVKRQVGASGSWSGEVRHTTQDGRQLLVETRIELFPFDGRRLVLETNRDVTERKTWDQRQQLLLAELTHRVKNILSVVQSMAHQTMRNSASLADFIQRFDGRLHALAGAHKLLVDSEWRGAELGALAHHQLQPYVLGVPGRLSVDGDAVILPARIATPFGLILHELATNAAKHGAWSIEGGTVQLSWRLETDADGINRLSVVWRERNGPPVQEPERLSFGARLIQSGLPGASVELTFAADGVVCAISMLLSETKPGAGVEAVPS